MLAWHLKMPYLIIENMEITNTPNHVISRARTPVTGSHRSSWLVAFSSRWLYIGQCVTKEMAKEINVSSPQHFFSLSYMLIFGLVGNNKFFTFICCRQFIKHLNL